MKRFMTLMLAFPLALTIAGAAMIGVTFATVGEGGDAAPQGGDGIAETATERSERITVGVDACWMRYSSWTRESAAETGESPSATGAQPLADWPTFIRICNHEDEVSVTTRTAGDRERVVVGENDCWSQTTVHRFGWIAPYNSVIDRATDAETPGGWWNAQLSESIRFCNLEGDVTVITEESSSSQWIPNMLPVDAIAA